MSNYDVDFSDNYHTEDCCCCGSALPQLEKSEDGYRVVCQDCGFQLMDGEKTIQLAVDAWNRSTSGD